MKVSVLLLVLSFVQLCVSTSTPCKLRKTKQGAVCVCTDDYCDYLEGPTLKNKKDIWVVSSSKEGLRFDTTQGSFKSNSKITIKDYNSRKTKVFVQSEPFDPDVVILDNEQGTLEYSSSRGILNLWPFRGSKAIKLNVDRNVQHQNVTGFGAAITGAVSHVLDQLSQDLQDHMYRSFFHKDGIAFDTLRMSIGGCDFDVEPWAYLEDFPGDTELKNFNKLDARDLIKVEQIKRLKKIAELDFIKIKAAAWSSPRWMKTNKAWTGFSSLKTEFYQAWANYHLRFLELMDEQGLPLWAISTGNEPMNGVLAIFTRFMDLGWRPSQMAVWLNDHLGPTIRNSTYKNLVIFGNDDNRYTYPAYFEEMKLKRANVLDYLDGLAVHWYTDFLLAPNLIDLAHEAMPDKIIVNTESCLGSTPVLAPRGVVMGSWKRGEFYIKEMIEGFQHHYNGWIDWNLILDEQGGPNYAKNYVDAGIIANLTSRTEIYKQPFLYAMGHFSKFVPAGSVRIEANINDIYLQSVAFKRPDDSIAVILFNSGRLPVDVSLNDSVRGKKIFNIPARSFHTIMYN